MAGSELVEYIAGETEFKNYDELNSHICKQLSNTGRKCRYCTYNAVNNADYVNHIATQHVEEKTYVCPVCGYDTKIQYELMNHMITSHDVEKENITNDCLSSLGGRQRQDKIDTDSNNQLDSLNANVQMLTHTSAKPKSYACSKCDFKCSNNISMKTHLIAHNTPEVYICEESSCTYECESKEDLQQHKEDDHPPTKDTRYSDILQLTESNSNVQDQYDWSRPFKNGRQEKIKHNNNSSNLDQNRMVANNRHEYNINNHRDNSAGAYKQYRPKANTIKGSNCNSSLAVAQQPHWAKVFTTRFNPGTKPEDIKKDLETNIKITTGKQYTIQVEQLPTKYDTYCSFKISCFCVESDIFMDDQIWPANVFIKWFKQRRTHVNGPEPRHRY